jgi:succinate-acetate transporter protein
VCFLLCFWATFNPPFLRVEISNEINTPNLSAVLFGAGIYAFTRAICGIKTTFALRLLKTTLQRLIVLPATWVAGARNRLLVGLI